MTVEGAAGGGLVPWATLAGYAEAGEIGGSAYITHVKPRDCAMQAMGAAVSISNRLELSATQQTFNIDQVVAGDTLGQKVIGAKLRLSGELMFSRWPQVSVGVQYKVNDSFTVARDAGASDDKGTDFYVAASKLWLAGPFDRTTFLNTTLRATRANQLGLMGFGGDRRDAHQLQGELSAGVFLNRHWVVGMEYRQKPDNLRAAREDDWYDAFIGWFPNKRVAVIGAWSNLGSIAGLDDQHSLYLSLQISQ